MNEIIETPDLRSATRVVAEMKRRDEVFKGRIEFNSIESAFISYGKDLCMKATDGYWGYANRKWYQNNCKGCKIISAEEYLKVEVCDE